jgi:NAD(P)H-flavin reductase
MRRGHAVIESIGLRPSHGRTLRLAMDKDDRPRPGQPYLGLRIGQAEPYRVTLIPFEIDAGGFVCAAPPDRKWRAGDELDLLGPLGPGFHPPRQALRWLLVSLVSDAGPLLPLIQLGKDRGASISMWASAVPSDLPADVEIATDLVAALDWSDYLALCATPSELSGLRNRLEIGDAFSLVGRRAEILLLAPMPCGFGGCIACAVRARRGWKLACLDGPVFPLEALSW